MIVRGPFFSVQRRTRNGIVEGARRVLGEPDLYREPPAAVREAVEGIAVTWT